jgi:dephospho-CoA kinase
MKPLLIGLTGGPGTGKSTVASMLAELGAEIISGDELGRHALEESPELLARVRVRFGSSVFHEDDTLDRRALGIRVFADPVHARWLTGLTFPSIYAAWLDAVSHCTKPVIVLDAALIFEWGISSDFDLLVVVTSDRSLVSGRLSAGNRLTPSEAEARLASQMPPEIKASRSHVTLDNSGPVSDLQESVRNFWNRYVQPELRKRSSSQHE